MPIMGAVGQSWSDATLELLLTRQRLSSYLSARNGNLADAMRLYEWNTTACAAAIQTVALADVIARNASASRRSRVCGLCDPDTIAAKRSTLKGTKRGLMTHGRHLDLGATKLRNTKCLSIVSRRVLAAFFGAAVPATGERFDDGMPMVRSSSDIRPIENDQIRPDQHSKPAV